MKLKQKLGQLFFSTMSHKLYDAGLYKIVSPYFWKCSPQKILHNYHNSVSENHLEIGVGTGYWLSQSGLNADRTQLSLMDLNQRCLDKSAKRLQEYSPNLYRQNILETFTKPETAVDSIGINYVLHCVPGDFTSKDVVFDNIHAVLNPGGVFFGATLLSRGVNRTIPARLLMALLNAMGIFFNQHDDLDEFQTAMRKKFPDAEIWVEGAAVLWRAVKK